MSDLLTAIICVILSASIGTAIGFIGGYKNKKDIKKLLAKQIKEEKKNE